MEEPIFIPVGFGFAVMASVAVTFAALPPFVSLSIVRQHTNYLKPVLPATNSRVRKYLKDYPDLLAAYDKEGRHNKAIKIKYLTDYNNRKLKD